MNAGKCRQLDYQADSASELEYLKRAHSKYIPDELPPLATGVNPDEDSEAKLGM